MQIQRQTHRWAHRPLILYCVMFGRRRSEVMDYYVITNYLRPPYVEPLSTTRMTSVFGTSLYAIEYVFKNAYTVRTRDVVPRGLRHRNL